MNNQFNVLVKPSVTFEVSSKIEFTALYRFLADVEPLYPNFKSWFNFTFRRNIGSGERQVVLAHDGVQIIGVALLKKNSIENKICTFYVSPEYRGLSIGNDLMDLALSTLDSNDTRITVSTERNSELSPLLFSKGFNVYQSLEGFYRQDSTEYFYKL
jgi:ribosomal protein S18 acetylase RimI-like enzyme